MRKNAISTLTTQSFVTLFTSLISCYKKNPNAPSLLCVVSLSFTTLYISGAWCKISLSPDTQLDTEYHFPAIAFNLIFSFLNMIIRASATQPNDYKTKAANIGLTAITCLLHLVQISSHAIRVNKKNYSPEFFRILIGVIAGLMTGITTCSSLSLLLSKEPFIPHEMYPLYGLTIMLLGAATLATLSKQSSTHPNYPLTLGTAITTFGLSIVISQPWPPEYNTIAAILTMALGSSIAQTQTFKGVLKTMLWPCVLQNTRRKQGQDRAPLLPEKKQDSGASQKPIDSNTM